MFTTFRSLVVAAAMTLVATMSHAVTYTFVGAWEVDDGPIWTDQPEAFTGQEAAALLFGGQASDYAISTISSLASEVNNMSWYSILGVFGGHEFAEDYDSSVGGLYYDGGPYTSDDLSNPASAYVNDNAIGPDFVNYAFLVDVAPIPVPAGFPLMAGGLAAFAVLRRSSKR